MKARRMTLLILFAGILLSTSDARALKAAVSPEPGNRLSEFFMVLSRKSGIAIEPVPLLPEEFADALSEGIVDLAVLPDTERDRESGEIQMPLWGSPVVLMSGNDMRIEERNIMDLKTIGVFIEDEPLLEREVIDRFSLDPRIQRVRHYDILVRIMATGRVSAIMIPLRDFERSIEELNQDKDSFGQPFPVGFKEDFLFLSRMNTDRTAPSMDRIRKAVEEMRLGGILEELSRIAR
ncbi:hypothetical protein [Spirochaeta isovalerica]|uniref:Solute-binding protein family 3/N-terminal domain-containing protein n=1 Tax=Spirochaeta isovalerica TaxID=150 RepID=A0A841RI81_9SPIO|nr:hypothetical protein [Spirochaeta isovalerica]MBB6482012.1 hypothetical protein [Spirochaeta isovalerica]